MIEPSKTHRPQHEFRSNNMQTIYNTLFERTQETHRGRERFQQQHGLTIKPNLDQELNVKNYLTVKTTSLQRNKRIQIAYSQRQRGVTLKQTLDLREAPFQYPIQQPTPMSNLTRPQSKQNKVFSIRTSRSNQRGASVVRSRNRVNDYSTIDAKPKSFYPHKSPRENSINSNKFQPVQSNLILESQSTNYQLLQSQNNSITGGIKESQESIFKAIDAMEHEDEKYERDKNIVALSQEIQKNIEVSLNDYFNNQGQNHFVLSSDDQLENCLKKFQSPKKYKNVMEAPKRQTEEKLDIVFGLDFQLEELSKNDSEEILKQLKQRDPMPQFKRKKPQVFNGKF